MVELSNACKEAIYLKNSFQELNIPLQLPIVIFCDNKSTCWLAENRSLSERSKHFAIDELFVRDYVKDKTICVKFVKSEANLADPMTKAYGEPKLKEWYARMGIVVQDESVQDENWDTLRR